MLTLLLFFAAAGFLAWFLLHNDRGPKEPKAALWEALGFGAVGLVLALIAETPLMPLDRAVRAGQLDLPTVLLFALCIGVIEEICKFLPLAAFIRDKRYFNEHTDGIIYFALTGLSFGLLENLIYFSHYGGGAGVKRLVLLLFFHSATSGIVGYYFARAKLRHESLARTAVALATIAMLHGLYDFGLFSGRTEFVILSLVMTATLNTGLFLYMLQGTEYDQAMGLAATGLNRYCRHCGWPNPQHMLFCEHCGAKS